MMKKPFLFAFAAVSVLLCGCSKMDDSSSGDRIVSLSATIVGDRSKAVVSDAGQFTWADGDEIGVWTSDAKFTKFSLKSGEAGKNTAVFTAELESGVTVLGPAVYPYRSGHSYDPSTKQLTYNQPGTMDWVENQTKSHMAAKYNGSGTIQFKHLDGLMRLTLINVPSTAAYLRLRSSDNVIIGDFTVDMNASEPQITAASTGGATSDFNFKVTPEDAVGGIYVVNFPIPTGTYNTTRISAQKADWAMIDNKITTTAPITVSRGTMVNMPAITLSSVLLSNSEDNTLRSNFNNGYSNPEGTSLSVVANSKKSAINASQYVVKLDASAQDPSDYQGGYFLLKTQNSDYSDNFRAGTKAFAVKVLFSDPSDATVYFPQAYVNGGKVGGVADALRLPDRVNGKAFSPQTAETWASLIKPGDWNVLQWTSDCSGTWRMEFTPFLNIDGTKAASGSKVIFFDDFEYIK